MSSSAENTHFSVPEDEVSHNKQVYNVIARHFSDTRQKPWDFVADFLDKQEPLSYGLETGCGNGKNMMYRDDLVFKGIDFSPEFVKICHERKLDVIEGDMRELPYADNTFDFVISIAVIHHLQHEGERIRAMNEMLRVVKPGGIVYIVVWAKTQEKSSKRIFNTTDEMVTWKNRTDNTIYHRYYHLYNMGDLTDEVEKTDYKTVSTEIYELNNHSITIRGVASPLTNPCRFISEE